MKYALEKQALKIIPENEKDVFLLGQLAAALQYKPTNTVWTRCSDTGSGELESMQVNVGILVQMVIDQAGRGGE